MLLSMHPSNLMRSSGELALSRYLLTEMSQNSTRFLGFSAQAGRPGLQVSLGHWGRFHRGAAL